MTPKVSVIIPVYNMEPYLRRCLDSVRGQTMRDIEILCVDDASTDGSPAILQSYAERDQRVLVETLPVNAGSGPARNRGIALARGQFLAFCDADDALPQQALAALHKAATDDGADMAAGNLCVMDEELRCRRPETAFMTAMTIRERACVAGLDNPALWIPLFHQKYLYSAKTIREHGLQYPHYRRGQDPPFLASALCAAQKISLIYEHVYMYRDFTKNKIASPEIWLEYLQHFNTTIEIFIKYGHIHCACLFYVCAVRYWCNIQCFQMEKKKTGDEIALFRNLAEKVAIYTPYTRDDAP
jgi:glycosyltransferase involved in cell wall biosynthesis